MSTVRLEYWSGWYLIDIGGPESGGDSDAVGTLGARLRAVALLDGVELGLSTAATATEVRHTIDWKSSQLSSEDVMLDGMTGVQRMLLTQRRTDA